MEERERLKSGKGWEKMAGTEAGTTKVEERAFYFLIPANLTTAVSHGAAGRCQIPFADAEIWC